MNRSVGQIMGILNQLAEPQPPASDLTLDHALVDELLRRSTSDYEPHFSRSVPRQISARDTAGGDSLPLPFAGGQAPGDAHKTTLARDTMANGGIRDHLGGGFHRYSTDAAWLVPHFEIMLYDNAMLALVYAEASRQFHEPRYAGVSPEASSILCSAT